MMLWFILRIVVENINKNSIFQKDTINKLYSN